MLLNCLAMRGCRCRPARCFKQKSCIHLNLVLSASWFSCHLSHHLQVLSFQLIFLFFPPSLAGLYLLSPVQNSPSMGGTGNAMGVGDMPPFGLSWDERGRKYSCFISLHFYFFGLFHSCTQNLWFLLCQLLIGLTAVSIDGLREMFFDLTEIGDFCL